MSATKDKFTTADKAFYADGKTANFVRPGLVVKIIAADGTAKARILFTDLHGLWLDRLGIQAPGNVGASFVLATIPKGETTYKAYTTRGQTSPITRVSATQAGADTTFNFVSDGSKVTGVRDIVRTAAGTCCHDSIAGAAHAQTMTPPIVSVRPTP
ncbi:MAG: hypothetical protein EXQ57_09620, partial [Bryobacterales bacterium]|nr:hypothetical protein [Bryobacterales bacterium]